MFLDKDITNKRTDTFPERMSKRGEHAYRGLVPSWFPGGWHFDKVVRAWSGEAVDFGGTPYELSEAISSAVGVKLRPKNIDDGYRFREFSFQRVERELSFLKNSLKRQLERKLISREEYDREITVISLKQKRIDQPRRESRLKRR